MKQSSLRPISIAFAGAMAAMVCVVTLFRFPLLGSKVHFANALCLLSGLLLGPWLGGLAAGLGSAIYDAFLGGYDIANVLITFVSKFAMAWVCAKLMYRGSDRQDSTRRVDRIHRMDRTVLASVLGALSYVALYMLKTYIYSRFVYGYPLDATWATMLGKLIPSLINAGVAVVATPIFFHAVVPALRAGGLLKYMYIGD